jgi:hypothetical protein
VKEANELEEEDRACNGQKPVTERREAGTKAHWRQKRFPRLPMFAPELLKPGRLSIPFRMFHAGQNHIG